MQLANGMSLQNWWSVKKHTCIYIYYTCIYYTCIYIYIYVYVQWSGVLELLLSRTTKIGQFRNIVRNIWKQLPIFKWNFFSSFPSVSKPVAVDGSSLLWKKNKKEDGANKQKKTNGFSFNPTPPCLYDHYKHYWSGFKSAFGGVLSQQNWCSYVTSSRSNTIKQIHWMSLNSILAHHIITSWYDKQKPWIANQQKTHPMNQQKKYFTPQLVWKHQRGSMNHPWVTPRLKMYQIWGVLNFDSCRNHCILGIEKYWMVLVPITSVSICLSHSRFEGRYWLYSCTSL